MLWNPGTATITVTCNPPLSDACLQVSMESPWVGEYSGAKEKGKKIKNPT